MRKQIYLLLLTFAILSMTNLLSNAAEVGNTFQIGAYFYTITNNDEGNRQVSLSRCDPNLTSDPSKWEWSQEITMTGQVNYNGVNYTLTAIGENACNPVFYGKKLPIPGVINLPWTIKKIDKNAFGDEGCKGMGTIQVITIPSSVEFIGESAFQGAFLPQDQSDSTKWLNQLNMMGGGRVGAKAFADNDFEAVDIEPLDNPINLNPGSGLMQTENTVFDQSQIFNLIIAGQVTIPMASFAGRNCFNIIYLNCPTVGIGCFENSGFSDKATQAYLELGPEVRVIMDHAFQNFNHIDSLEMGSQYAYIGQDAFRNCGLKYVELQDDFNGIIYPGAFQLNDQFEKAGIYCKKVGDYSFAYNHNIKQLVLGPKVEEIGLQAFEECSGLTDIYLGVKVDDAQASNPKVASCKTNAFTAAGYNNGTECVIQPMWAQSTNSQYKDPKLNYNALKIVNVHITPIMEQGTTMTALSGDDNYTKCLEGLRGTLCGTDSSAKLFNMVKAANDDPQYNNPVAFPANLMEIPDDVESYLEKSPSLKAPGMRISNAGDENNVDLEDNEEAYYHQGFDRCFEISYYCYTNSLKGYDSSLPEKDYLCYEPAKAHNTTGGTIDGLACNMGNFHYVPADKSQNSVVNQKYFPPVTKDTPTAIPDLGDNGNTMAVTVTDGTIMAPEGSRIYRLDGTTSDGHNVAPGIYIVRFGTQSTKILVR